MRLQTNDLSTEISPQSLKKKQEEEQQKQQGVEEDFEIIMIHDVAAPHN
jgi:hypothetical protein